MIQTTRKKFSPRRFKAKITILGSTQICLRNPLIVAWWSIAFPGLGHIMLHKYLSGYILFIWEVLVNYKSHLNLALIYSFIGRFNMAKDIIDKRWIFLYLPTYFFAIWDSYRTTIDLNNIHVLASREGADINVLAVDAVEINYLDKRVPWNSFFISALSPGMGHLYIHRIPASFFILIWWIVIVISSNLFPAVYYTFIGQFEVSKSLINPQWFINIPSIYLFTMYDSYLKTVESNKLFEWEQSKYFNEEYNNNSFNLPFNTEENRGDELYIFSIFEHSISLEKAVTLIEKKGISKESILVLPMDKKNENGKLFDSINNSDGLSMLDLPMVLATFSAIFGSIYGFVLVMGPIIWGLIGAVIGFIIGLIIKLYNVKRSLSWKHSIKEAEVIVVVQCKSGELEIIKDILWQNNAIGVRELV